MADHEFIAIVTYDLTWQQAKALTEGPVGPPTYAAPNVENPRLLADGRANLRVEDIRKGVFAGCLVCELPYEPGMEHTECPGEPDSYSPEGVPSWQT